MTTTEIKEKYKNIYEKIEGIKFLFSLGDNIDEDKVDNLFFELFDLDKQVFDGEYHTAEEMTVFFDEINIIADNFIRKRDSMSLFGHMLEWTDVFKGFVSHPQFNEDEKLSVKKSFQTLERKVNDYMVFESKGEETIKKERISRNQKNIRSTDCKCLLCRKNLANEIGSHMVPNMLIERFFAYQGKKGRDYENVERHTLSETEKYAYVGRSINPEEKEKIVGRPLREDEKYGALEEHNPLTFDYFFCKDCEKRFGTIETWYGEISNHPNKSYPAAVPYLFWMSVVWRMSISKMCIVLPPNHEEKYRRILDNALAIDKNKINLNIRKLGHCAYTINQAQNTKGEGLGIIGIPVPTVPALFLIGDKVIRFYHSLDKAKKINAQLGYPNNLINFGQKKEIIGSYSFIEFWRAKRYILDHNWRIDFDQRIGDGTGVSQFVMRKDFEKEHLESTGELINIMPAIKTKDEYRLIEPCAVHKINSYLRSHAPKSKEELFDATGYTEEEVSEIMSYWLAKSEKDLEKQ